MKEIIDMNEQEFLALAKQIKNKIDKLVTEDTIYVVIVGTQFLTGNKIGEDDEMGAAGVSSFGRMPPSAVPALLIEHAKKLLKNQAEMN